jgi:hypothetical protein
MIMSKTIVRFENGKYAIRCGVFFYNYVDLKSTEYRWKKSDAYFKDCVGTLKEVEEAFGYFKEIKVK